MRKEFKIHIFHEDADTLCKAGNLYLHPVVSLDAYAIIRYYNGLKKPAPYFCKNCVRAFVSGEK